MAEAGGMVGCGWANVWRRRACLVEHRSLSTPLLRLLLLQLLLSAEQVRRVQRQAEHVGKGALVLEALRLGEGRGFGGAVAQAVGDSYGVALCRGVLGSDTAVFDLRKRRLHHVACRLVFGHAHECKVPRHAEDTHVNLHEHHAGCLGSARLDAGASFAFIVRHPTRGRQGGLGGHALRAAGCGRAEQAMQGGTTEGGGCKVSGFGCE